MAASNRLGTTPSFRSSQISLSICFSSQTPLPMQQDSYQELADPAQVGCWHPAPIAKQRADLLLPSFNAARN